MFFVLSLPQKSEDSPRIVILKEYKHECNEYVNRGEQAKGYSEGSPVR